MSWQIRVSRFVAIAASLLSLPALSQTLYVSNGSGGVAGNLYIVDTTTAAVTPVGPILAGGLPIATSALAFQPTTRVLYATTSNNSPNIPKHLVKINPVTAVATDVGALGIGGADLAFDAAGTLYMTSGQSQSLFTVNLATGAATLVGATGTGDAGSGLAINGAGVAFFAGNGDDGQLATLNLATGAATLGATLTGAPNASGSIDSMKFSPNGVLFAVDNNFGPVNNLVTIDTATGAVTNIGALPASIDGLAFAPFVAGAQVPTMSEWGLAIMALLLAAAGLLAMKRRMR